MKQGKTLVELATELERRSNSKADYIADTRELALQLDPSKPEADPVLNIEGITDGVAGADRFGITNHAHRQLGTHVGIPAKYYDRMRSEAPALLVGNVNHWLRENPARRMIRTLDGDARAILSDRYRRVDNEDVARAVLPVLMDTPEIRIVSTEITDAKMYIKALFPRIAGEVKVDDPVQSGIVISNSEIGQGAISVQPLIFRLVCSNGMIAKDAGVRRHHVGSRIDVMDNASELYRDETIAADDRALLMKLTDVVRASMDQVAFENILERMRIAAASEKVQAPIKAVEVMAKTFGFNDAEQGDILANLITGGDLSKWGVLNAVTATANTIESYDRATELEAIGGTILDLPTTEWERVAQAA